MRLFRFAAPLLALSFVVGCGGSSAHISSVNARAKQGTGFQTIQLEGHNRKFGVFLPLNYTPAKKWPTLVFLHGIGETGNNGQSCMNVGLGPEIAKRADTFPFIVIFPQTSGGWRGVNDDKVAIDALEQAKRQFAVDPDRVIVTGLSSGGYGAWRLAALYRDKFAAAVPMCGYAFDEGVPKLTTIPIWCWHNSGDWAVPSGGSKRMVEKINAAGGNARLTVPNAGGHDVWVAAYDHAPLYQWMLAQRRPGSAAAAGGN